jgi:hypothetical protein
MSEFIVLTGYETGNQVLINTEDIVMVEQSVSSASPEPVTEIVRRGGYARMRVRESVASITTLLSAPIGRVYALYSTFGGYQSSSQQIKF